SVRKRWLPLVVFSLQPGGTRVTTSPPRPTAGVGVSKIRGAALPGPSKRVGPPPPADIDTEVKIVRKRVAEIGSGLQLPAPPPAEEAVRKIVQIFQELRRGQTIDGKQKIKPPSGVLSTAEAISLFGNSMALAGHFGRGQV